MSVPLWKRSAGELAAAIRARETTSREVIEAHLARIAEVEPACHALGAVLADTALAAADAADLAQRRGDALGPLHGVPMTVKENIDVAGSATTQGVVVMKDAVPPLDAPHVAQLRSAGAIVIARTNLPDFGLRWHSESSLRGTTVNPWDASRTRRRSRRPSSRRPCSSSWSRGRWRAGSRICASRSAACRAATYAIPGGHKRRSRVRARSSPCASR